MAVPAAALMNQGANSFCNLESGIASLNVSPAKSSSMRLNAGQSTKFSLGHRKTQSLGSKWVLQCIFYYLTWWECFSRFSFFEFIYSYCNSLSITQFIFFFVFMKRSSFINFHGNFLTLILFEYFICGGWFEY
jgi:hypothetical protein